MSLGEINKGVVALLLALVLGAGGYLWYSQMYKPAVAERVTAQAAATTAQSGLAAAKAELEAAQKRIDDAKRGDGKVDDSVPRLAKARTAVPDEALVDDATIVLMDFADRSGMRTNFNYDDDDQTANGGAAGASAGLQGATPVDVEFQAAGTYAEMMNFMTLVESTVEVKNDTLYSRGRLFNVVKLEIGAKESTSTTNTGGFNATPEDQLSSDLVPRRGETLFTITVRMYTSSTQNAQGVGAATPDAAAAPTTSATPAAGAAGGAGTAGTPAANSTSDPAATGGAADGASGATNSTGTGTPAAGSSNTTGGAATGGAAPTPAPAAATGGN